jgi:hypothetical protein
VKQISQHSVSKERLAFVIMQMSFIDLDLVSSCSVTSAGIDPSQGDAINYRQNTCTKD